MGFLYKNSLLIFFFISSFILSCTNPAVTKEDDSSTTDSTEKKKVVTRDTVWKDGGINEISIIEASLDSSVIENFSLKKKADALYLDSLEMPCIEYSHSLTKGGKTHRKEMQFLIPDGTFSELPSPLSLNVINDYPIAFYTESLNSVESISKDSAIWMDKVVRLNLLDKTYVLNSTDAHSIASAELMNNNFDMEPNSQFCEIIKEKLLGPNEQELVENSQNFCGEQQPINLHEALVDIDQYPNAVLSVYIYIDLKKK